MTKCRAVFLQQGKMLFVAFKEAFVSELAYFCGQTASVNLEVVGELLSVVGDIKASASGFFGFYGKVSQKLFSCCFLCGVLDLLVEINGFCCKVFHKIEYKLLMKSAMIRAGM